MSKKISKKVVISEEENNSDSSSSEPVVITKKSKKPGSKVNKPDTRTLPALYSVDSKGKDRVWKCWVIENTIYREHGLVTGKKILSERTFEGKSIGKKNETSPTEQAWMEANKEWVSHTVKEYRPAADDKEGMKMLKNLEETTKKTGGSNVNAVAAISGGAQKTKVLSRKKEDTNMADEVEGGTVLPMKALEWELTDSSDPYSVAPKVEKYFSTLSGKGKAMKMESTPFFGQCKLDGWRCRIMIQTVSNGPEIVMTTNSGKQYRWFTELRVAALEWLNKCSADDILDGLDGELYAMQLYNSDGTAIPEDARFSNVSSICGVSRSNPHELENQIQFHCFDLFDKSGTLTQVERFKHRDALFKKLPKAYKDKIIKVDTRILNNVKEVVDYHGECAEQGYEGCILRTFGMKYRPGTRNPEMRKFKLFKDAEYEIIGFKLDKGVSLEQFVFLLKTEDGKEFSAKPMGSKDEKIGWYTNRKDHVGKFVTVKFQEFSEDGVPRFPIAKSFRAGVGTD